MIRRILRACIVLSLAAGSLAAPTAARAAPVRVPHPGIYIDGDADFRLGPLVGVVNPLAAGTRDDPFVIEGPWDISPGTVSSLSARPPGKGGIHIQNTNAHAVVRNNSVHGWNQLNRSAGIYLSNANNVTLDGNVVRDNGRGIVVDTSRFLVISSDYIESNGVGLTLIGPTSGPIFNNYFANASTLDVSLWIDIGVIWNIFKTDARGPNILGERWQGGNFWSDYNRIVDADCDFLGDFPHGRDNLPLVKRGPRLEVSPPEVLVIPEEQLELVAERVEADCVTRRKLDATEVAIGVSGSSHEVTRDGPKARIDVFGSGDVDGRGTVNVSAGGLSFPVSYALVAPSAADVASIDGLNADLADKIATYNGAVGRFRSSRPPFESEHRKIDTNTLGSRLPHEAFRFTNLSWSGVKAGMTAPLTDIRNPYNGALIPEASAFFRNQPAQVTLRAEDDPQRLGSNGLTDCRPPGYTWRCYRVRFTMRFTLQQPFSAGATDRVFQEHRNFGVTARTALAASYITADGQPKVIYITQPPSWCGRVFAASSMGTTTCGVTWQGNTIAADTDTWLFDGVTYPREEPWWDGSLGFPQLNATDVQVLAGEFFDLGSAEAAAAREYTNMVKEQAALAKRKVDAIAELQRASAELARSTGPMRSTWQDYAQRMSSGLGEFAEELSRRIQNDPEITQEVKDRVSGLASQFDRGRAVADLFVLMTRADDPNLSDFDRLRAVKQALDIGRRLGPGGPLVALLNPFFEFYSQALEAIADALEKIDNMRKEMVLSTGECSIIRSVIADPQRQRAWEAACKLRQLLNRVRDP